MYINLAVLKPQNRKYRTDQIMKVKNPMATANNITQITNKYQWAKISLTIVTPLYILDLVQNNR